jgi:hypothetical protein
MAIACTQTATLFVLYVTPGKVETAMFTITNPLMQGKITWRPEEYQDDFLDEELARESARNMASPLTENSYASIIETALDILLE